MGRVSYTEAWALKTKEKTWNDSGQIKKGKEDVFFSEMVRLTDTIFNMGAKISDLRHCFKQFHWTNEMGEQVTLYWLKIPIHNEKALEITEEIKENTMQKWRCKQAKQTKF